MTGLSDQSARSLMVAAGLGPLEPYPGNARVPWKCHCTLCGKEVKVRYEQIRRRAGRRGCQACCSDAIDPKKAKALMLKAGLEPLGPFRGTNEWGQPQRQTFEQLGRRSAVGVGSLHECPAKKFSTPIADLRGTFDVSKQ